MVCFLWWDYFIEYLETSTLKERSGRWGAAQLIGSTPSRHQATAVPQQTYWVCWCMPEKSEEEGEGKQEGSRDF